MDLDETGVNNEQRAEVQSRIAREAAQNREQEENQRKKQKGH